MFTGIVEERGAVTDVRRNPSGVLLTVRGSLVTSDAEPGASIAVNGCCLTVVDVHPSDGTFTVDVVAETLRCTSLRDVRAGQDVNLERAVTASTRMSGHIVQGHVDGVGTILERRNAGGEDEIVWFGLTPDLVRYVVPKGSIAVDGVSLTVVDVRDEPDPAFSVALIPTTLRMTTLGQKSEGDAVNLEVDVMSKYVERHLARLGLAGMGGELSTFPTVDEAVSQGSIA